MPYRCAAEGKTAKQAKDPATRQTQGESASLNDAVRKTMKVRAAGGAILRAWWGAAVLTARRRGGLCVGAQGLNERGEKLAELGDKTAELSNQAGNFADLARQLRQKHEKKKWYEL